MKKVSTQDLIDLLPNYELLPDAEDYVVQTLNEDPSREVGQYARKNVTGAYSSPSQGITIQYESHTSELAWLIRWELDDDVIGFRDQPPHIDISKKDKNGVMRLSRYTPDFLIFRSNTIRVVEVKPEQELEKLAEKYPDQWQCTDGVWRYLPAIQAFREKGLVHEVCSLSSDRTIETNNIKLLIQAQRAQTDVEPEVKANVLSALDETAWLTVADLKQQVPAATSNDIYLLILEGSLFVDMQKQLLGDLESCLVATDLEILRIKELHEWAAPKVVDSVSTNAVPDKAELEKALSRLSRVQSGDKSRHARRLRKRIAQLSKTGTSALQALVMPKRGSTKSKLPDIVRLALIDHIRSHYMTHKRPKLYTSWTNYRNQVKELHPQYAPVSRNTYQKYVDLQDAEAVAFSRGGKRAANAEAGSTDTKDRAIRATRPLERGAVDHTKLKMLVEVVESNGSVYTKKPWLTVLMDEHSGYWISFFLTLKAPSKRSLSVLVRNCVREHGKLPETIHSDRGSDFRSKYYRALLAHYGVTADYSPAGHSRYNSQVERINKQIKDQWLSQRPGNTIDYQETRKYSKGHRPQDIACISLDELFVEIEEYRQQYNETVVGAAVESPKSIFEKGLLDFPFSGVPVTENDEFLLITAFDTNAKEYKIGSRGEVLYNNLHFYHSLLRKICPKRSHTELRIDPEDPYRVYCKVENEWVTALNSRHKEFSAQLCMTRWAEAVRVAEGSSLRRKAKQEASDLKAAIAQKLDDEYVETTESVESIASQSVDEPSPELDLFEELRQKAVRDLDSEVA